MHGELPIVEVNRQHAGDLLDAAVADNFHGAYQMTAYLIGLGHRRIGLILGEMELITGKNRLEGYRRAHQDAGLTINPAYLCTGSFNRQYGEQAARELLALPEPPTAIFAGNNRILMGCLAVLGEQGVVFRKTCPWRVRYFRMARHLAAPDHGSQRSGRGDRPPGRRAALAPDWCTLSGSLAGGDKPVTYTFKHNPGRPGIVSTPTGVLIGHVGGRDQ